MFGKSFDEKVQDAVGQLAGLHIKGLNAKVDGKVVTLYGEAPDVPTKAKAMEVFNSLVETENTVNAIKVAQAAAPKPTAHPFPASGPDAMGPPMSAAAPIPAPAATARVHEVVKGETLSAIAKHYYGKASRYHEIFEANKDVLKDPDHIYPGQKLKIP